jgi:hypothetical protein
LYNSQNRHPQKSTDPAPLDGQVFVGAYDHTPLSRTRGASEVTASSNAKMYSTLPTSRFLPGRFCWPGYGPQSGKLSAKKISKSGLIMSYENILYPLAR